MERKAAKGRWTNGATPYGYRIDPDTEKLAPHASERKIVELAFDLYTRLRLGTRAIAAMLNDRGLRTRRNRPWSGRTIHLMLINPVYIGTITFRDVEAADAHEPLVDQVTFERAGQLLTERGIDHGKRRANGSDYDLTGLIVCPRCGHHYLGANAHGHNRTYRYYTCPTRLRYGTTRGCNSHRLNADALDAAIRDALLDFYTTRTDLISAALDTFQQAHRDNTADQRRELVAIDRELATGQTAIDRYHHAFETGAMDPDTCQRRLNELTTQASQLRAHRSQLTTAIDSPPTGPSPVDLEIIQEHI